MAARAVRCFNAQTYRQKELLVYCTDDHDGYGHVATPWLTFRDDRRIGLVASHERQAFSIGALRNAANDQAGSMAQVIIHWDDDDISHPNRIAEQVALLQSSGADCVGYREMLFWQAIAGQFCGAWLYRHSHQNYCLGTSLCYWRKAWENCKFPDTSVGEDLAFVQRVKALGVSAIDDEPRMIATIHGGNTSSAYTAANMAKEEWKRAPEWDAAVRKMVEEA